MDFRSHILTELALSERIIRKGMGVAPRFTVFAPDGTYTAMVELPDGEQERSKQLSAIRGFMIFKAARGFLLASEIIDQDVISVIAGAPIGSHRRSETYQSRPAELWQNGVVRSRKLSPESCDPGNPTAQTT